MLIFKKYFVPILFILLTPTLNGCQTDQIYTPPTKVQTNSVQSQSSNTQEKSTPKTTIFKVGETATDKQLNITLNNIRFTSKIAEQANQYMTATSKNGDEYAILDITIDNLLLDKTQSISSILSMSMTDQDGYSYSSDFTALTALEKAYKDGEILPGMKNRGEIAFEVPKDAKELNFIFKFDAFNGTSAVFKIK